MSVPKSLAAGAAAFGLLAAGYAATFPTALPRPLRSPRHAARPPAEVRLNGQRLDMSPFQEVAEGVPEIPLTGRGGEDPGGIRPARGRRLLSITSGRDDALGAAFHDADAVATAALEARLAAEGWARLDFGEGLGLWTRGGESLLLEAPGPGRPGTALVYWRAPGGSR